MARDVSGRLTRREGMRFAFTLAGAFFTLALVAWWRGRHGLAAALALIAAIAASSGAIAPTRLGGAERVWMRFGELLSRVTAPIFLAIVYFLVLTPVALVRRALGRSAIARSRSSASYWFLRDTPGSDENRRRRMERQF